MPYESYRWKHLQVNKSKSKSEQEKSKSKHALVHNLVLLSQLMKPFKVLVVNLRLLIRRIAMPMLSADVMLCNVNEVLGIVGSLLLDESDECGIRLM